MDFDLPTHSLQAEIPPIAPSIESNRLILRPATDSDIPGLFAVRSRPEVALTNYPKEPFKTLEQTREWWASKVFREPAAACGRSFSFVILDKSIPDTEEQIIGYVSINDVVPSPEIGYSILPESWGKGFATEALDMMLTMWWDLPRRSWGDDEVEKVYAIVEKINLGSRAVLAKCGFADDNFRSELLDVYVLAKPAQATAKPYHYISRSGF